MAACRAVIGLLSVRGTRTMVGCGIARTCPAAGLSGMSCQEPRLGAREGLAEGYQSKGCDSAPTATDEGCGSRTIAGPSAGRGGGPGEHGRGGRDERVEEPAELTLDVDIAVRSPDDAQPAIRRDSRPHPAARPVERD